MPTLHLTATVRGARAHPQIRAIRPVDLKHALARGLSDFMAMLTSSRLVFESPLAMSLWGMIVAGLLVIGSLPFFIGLAVVMPVLGHSTWHLYRKAVIAP